MLRTLERLALLPARLFAGIALLLALALPTAPPARAADGDPLFPVIAERLGMMRGVAAFKALEGRPVEDLAREAVVLDASAARAAGQGLDAAGVRPFFRAQIEAAKEIQHCWIARWQGGSHPMPATAPDLVAEIRPDLIALGNRIVAEIDRRTPPGGAGPASASDRAAFDAALAPIDCLGAEAQGKIFSALTAIRRAP